MKMKQLFEANIASKIKDPKIIKQIAIAMRHDSTLPQAAVAKLGPRPDDQTVLALWSVLLDKSLSNTRYGNVSADGKFDEWLTRLYINGVVDYEDVNGEGGDALGAFKALSIRGRLSEKDQDVNRFKNLRQLQNVINKPEYRAELSRIQNQEEIEKHKREKKEIVILDDERFLVVVPLNYGSCYTFNNAHGFSASFCTGSSSGLRWFGRYAPEGPLISVFDKENPDDVNGKWQIHAPTEQCNNGNQTITYRNGDKKFAELFPGLLKQIAQGLKAHAAEINQGSQEIVSGGYDVDAAIKDIASKFPHSWASGKEEPEHQEQAPETDGPGTFAVTHIPSGRTANLTADSREHLMQRLRDRYPNYPDQDYQIQRVQA